MILRIVLRSLAIITLALISAPWVWQVCTGDYFMRVTGPSMEPTYHIGDTLLVQKPTGHDLEQVGNIVVVSFAPGDQQNQYVHRVHAVTELGAQLKGDNNEAVDPGDVTESLVMGTPRAHIVGGLSQAYQLSQVWPVRVVAAAIIIPGLAIRIRPKRKRDADASLTTSKPASRPEHGTGHRGDNHDRVDLPGPTNRDHMFTPLKPAHAPQGDLT